MTRIFADEDLSGRDGAVLSENNSRYLSKVLRCRIGQTLAVFDVTGKEYTAEISSITGSTVALRIKACRETHRESPLALTLAQSLLKGRKMDLVVQKATELGVHEIAPFVSHRSVPQTEATKAQEKYDRWCKIAREAARQCGRTMLPEVLAIATLGDLLRERKGGDVVLLWEGSVNPIRLALERFRGAERLCVVIGPEGGFTEEEVEEASTAGALIASLGRRILRAETAALAVLSLVQYELGDLG